VNAVGPRILIVNADDLGQSPGINRGVMAAHRDGIVTAASLMVRWPYAPEAARLAREHPGLDLGLHFDTGEWWFDDPTWQPLYRVVSNEDEPAVRAEARRQVERFRGLVGRDPTHLDSHQHVHLAEPVQSVLTELAAELGVPLRAVTPGVEYRGDFYGQTGKGDRLPEAITIASLLSLLASLPPGVTELGCHPAAAADVPSSYRTERVQELRVLCDPRVRQAVLRHGIRLCGWSAAPTVDNGWGGAENRADAHRPRSRDPAC
jgi:predicted glycoside hydrolase/deacetylase ChbG (UPF0249 family)